MKTITRMDALNHNPIFNAGGLATVLAFFGLNGINIAAWADVNIMLLVVIGIVSLVFTAMKMYHQFLQTKRLKDQIRKDRDAK